MPQTQVESLYRTIEDQFHAIPGVVKVGISTYTPMEDNNWSNSVQIQGQPDPNKGASWVKGNAEYFDSVGTHVLMGRGFTPQDLLAAPPVAVVNKEFVKQFFKPGENPIGHRMGSPGPKSPGDYRDRWRGRRHHLHRGAVERSRHVLRAHHAAPGQRQRARSPKTYRSMQAPSSFRPIAR